MNTLIRSFCGIMSNNFNRLLSNKIQGNNIIRKSYAKLFAKNVKAFKDTVFFENHGAQTLDLLWLPVIYVFNIQKTFYLYFWRFDRERSLTEKTIFQKNFNF